MIRTGIDALRSAQLDFLVSDATYRRGAEARGVKAVLGRTVFRSMHITVFVCTGEVCANSQCDKGQCMVPKRLARMEG